MLPRGIDPEDEDTRNNYQKVRARQGEEVRIRRVLQSVAVKERSGRKPLAGVDEDVHDVGAHAEDAESGQRDDDDAVVEPRENIIIFALASQSGSCSDWPPTTL